MVDLASTRSRRIGQGINKDWFHKFWWLMVGVSAILVLMIYGRLVPGEDAKVAGSFSRWKDPATPPTDATSLFQPLLIRTSLWERGGGRCGVRGGGRGALYLIS